MSFNFSTYKETNNLLPQKIEEKESYYHDLNNLEFSWTGRIDAQISNTFILESNQLIVNAIALFEKGYFDCAFYSLRQSLEVSTTMIYLVDNKQEIRDSELKKWKSQSWFPMYSQMIKHLKKHGPVFSEIRNCMSDYFQEIKSIKKKLNKYVHKQGFKTFYVSRNHPVNRNKKNNFSQEFEFYLRKCIGAVAVFRLSIDPFPILLTDDKVYHRTGDLMTKAYSGEFIAKYIGKENIEKYKSTNFYSSHYDHIMLEEEKSPCVSHVVKDQFIDLEKLDEILKQKHLLSQHDLIAVLLSSISKNVSKIYCLGGLHMYFTSTNSKRKSWSWSSEDFNSFEKNEDKYNQRYDEAYISCVKLYQEYYFIEHNEEFGGVELHVLQKLRDKYENRNIENYVNPNIEL